MRLLLLQGLSLFIRPEASRPLAVMDDTIGERSTAMSCARNATVTVADIVFVLSQEVNWACFLGKESLRGTGMHGSAKNGNH